MNMDSFHIPLPPEKKSSFDFDPEDFSGISCLNASCALDDGSPEEVEDDIELPLPPGTSDEFFFPVPPKEGSFNNSSLRTSKLKLVSDSYEDFGNGKDFHLQVDEKVKNLQEDLDSKANEFLDDKKYSPSKVDSDDDNQDFISTKPKVLGKEQAKKRLMAFSLSKQPNTSVKKNKTIITVKNKEKPPNPNKGSNVQDQFRATISAIEEEKKKMFQNMPSYLLMEMSELTGSHSSMSSSAQLLEKLKKESLESKNSAKEENTLSKCREESKRSRRSRSHSRSKKRRRSGSRSNRSRSRSRNKGSPRRRSHSKSRKNRSRVREEKNKANNKVLQESQSTPKQKFENWKSLKASGVVLEDLIKSTQEDKSPITRPNFKPIFNYLNKPSAEMTVLQAKPVDPKHSSTLLFSEKIIKYTRTKPVLCWSENPSLATEYYMPTKTLLENCDQTTSSIVLSIIENKNLQSFAKDMLDLTPYKNRQWYPRNDYLLPNALNNKNNMDGNDFSAANSFSLDNDEKNDKDQEHTDENETESIKIRAVKEPKISLVNDSYLSDEEDPLKEITVENSNAHSTACDVSSVNVRSKWDSDCEEERMVKDPSSLQINISGEAKPDVQKTIQKESLCKAFVDDFDILSCHLNYTEKENPSPERLNLNVGNFESTAKKQGTAENLVSEYEEFLKMVAVDSGGKIDSQNQMINLKSEMFPETKSDKHNKDNKKLRDSKLEITDWDQESDREDSSSDKKTQFSGSIHEFSILGKSETEYRNIRKIDKKLSSEKTGKLKTVRKKVQKKSSKGKKKYKDYSENSSSESFHSDSDSDSDDSDQLLDKKKKKKKNKKKKVSKTKKSRKDSSSENESDSNDSTSDKKKKRFKKKKRRKDSSSDQSDETQNSWLKQLDFKKQLIMKKIEQIDCISDKNSKKKKKETKEKKTDRDSSKDREEKGRKSKKKEYDDVKYDRKKSNTNKGLEKCKKSTKSDTSSKSDSESNYKSTKKKRSESTRKKKRSSSESDDEKDSQKFKSQSSKKLSKNRKKYKSDSNTSDSSVSESSSKDTKKAKRKNDKIKNNNQTLENTAVLKLEDNLMQTVNREQAGWENKKFWKKGEEKAKVKKAKNGWEASSTSEESGRDNKTRESSWDEEVPNRDTQARIAEELAKTDKICGNELKENTETNKLASETLKTSMSNFSFNENSFCSFGQELSRDFFLTERSFSNSGAISCNENNKSILIEPRPFKSVSKDSEVKKPSESELYSPGCSDSDLSETEVPQSDTVKQTRINTEDNVRTDVYDPLNCDSDGSLDNNDIELSSIPLPRAPSNTEKVCYLPSSSNSESAVLKYMPSNEADKILLATPPVKSCFTIGDFTSVATSQPPFKEEKITPTKRQLMSVKGQQKLISKAAAVFQDESDEENIEPVNKNKTGDTTQDSMSRDISLGSKDKTVESKAQAVDQQSEEKTDTKKSKKESRDKYRERSSDREGRRRRSRSREKRDTNRSDRKRSVSPGRNKRRSKTPEVAREKREIRSDSFEIEPLKSVYESTDLTDMVQPIPVLTSLEKTSEGLWSRSLMPTTDFSHLSNSRIDHAESFDIYPSEESNFRSKNYIELNENRGSSEKSKEGKGKKERKKSRSRSYSPKKKLRSKSPERRKSPRGRSPRRKSVSPNRRDKSPFSPRRKSPKRKSPSRRYRNSRSPDKKRKSQSRSPRRRRNSPSRRSKSPSPKKYRSPKHRGEKETARNHSPKNHCSPRKDFYHFQSYPEGLQNRIPVIGASNDDVDIDLSSSAMCKNSVNFSQHIPDSVVTEPEFYSSFFDGEYTDEYGMRGYRDEVGVNNLITVKNHDIEKVNSPERLSLDQRIELELAAPISNSQTHTDQYQMSNECPPFQDMNSSHFHGSYNCDNSSIGNDNFYQNQNVQTNVDFNGQYFNGHQQQPPSTYGSYEQYPNPQPVTNSVMQVNNKAVGNIVEVIPSLQHPPPALSANPPQIMQVGNVLQVVPNQKSAGSNFGSSEISPMVKTQKATAVVAPSSIIPTPNPETVLNPLIKAIQLEREKRRKEKEKRRAEREARRKARQLKREAKLMSVNEKLKKSVQNEGLMLGQEVEDDELLDGLDVPSPPIPVEIITVSSPSALPPAGKGILITAGFMPKPPSEKKEVKFADGVCPGEGTSTSGGEEIASPPPKPKLPKEKRFKKKKTKVKKKVKVQIIRQIIQEEEEDDDDDLSPPPPPPGDPPPVFFARFPFGGEAQFPVYQAQTTTTTLTTVQYPAPTFD